MEASWSALAESYPSFFAKLIAYLASESWHVAKANVGYLLVAPVFVLGVWKAIEVAMWVVRKL